VNDAVRLAPGAFPGQAVVARLARVGERVRRLDRDHPWLLDAGSTVAYFVFLCLPDLLRGNHLDPGELRFRLVQLSAAGTLAVQLGLLVPLLWRRRAPVATFAVIAAVFMAHWSMGVFLRADFALLVALYGLALRGRPRQLFWACVAMIAPLAVVVVRVAALVNAVEALFFLVSAVTAAVALGLVVRVRRAQLATLRDRAARLEIERDQRSKLAAATERTRVAREMHDIIGHNLSVIITLADAGAYAGETSPRRATEALRLVGDSGRQALGELRRMLGVLREQRGEPELSPQPCIADVEALCARLRAAGPAIVYRSAGDLDALDRGMQLMAYRIVQEALTNALRHAGAATRVTVSLTRSDERLRIQVRDTGQPAGSRSGQPAEEGQGIAGMRERAALYAGAVTAGPTPDGGWAVAAVLPIDSGDQP
jgi:signal transduction histidine kinase